MRVLAIDPGSEQTAFMVFDGQKILDMGMEPNETALVSIGTIGGQSEADACAIEMVASYGMAVGREVFETVYWIGRFAERWTQRTGQEAHRLVRRDMKMHLCGNNRAKDSNIRAALLDRFGPGKALAVGTKKAPGPLYGVKQDLWAALAVAVTFADRAKTRPALETLERM